MGYTGKKPATSAQIDSSADIVDGVIQSQDIQTLDAAKLTGTVVDARISALTASKLTGTVATARLGTGTADSTKFLRGDNTWQVVAVGATALDTPIITGTLSVTDGGTVTHTINNWSDDLSWTITPTNCTVGTVNASGQFVITHTSGAPSYTIKSTTDSLGLADSALVTKNIVMQLSTPTLSSPADVGTSVNVTYTITSTSASDDKLILNMGSSNFTYQSVSVGTASKVGNTVECIGFTTNNPAVVIQYTAEATYSVTATAVKIDGTYGTSAASSADSITINNFIGMIATGGTITTVDTDYKVHTFNSSGTFQITTLGSTGTVDYLVVAGGGGAACGGAGAGGLRSTFTATGGGGSLESDLSVSATSYSVTVGGGGAGAALAEVANAGSGANGANSVFSSITSIAGGGSGGNSVTGSNGGSGGGAGLSSSYTRSGGSGTSNQGYAGGNVNNLGSPYPSGGGGGAGAVGAGTSGASGAGGAGVATSITGSSVTYAGGGGGGSYMSGSGGAGGSGGGGPGNVSGSGGGTNGTANKGSGGGGGSSGSVAGGNGGTGVVIIRYKFQ